MASIVQEELTCRIRVTKPEETPRIAPFEHHHHPESKIVDLKDCPETNEEIRTKWASEVMNHFKGANDNTIRPWDFLAGPDGSITRLLPPTLATTTTTTTDTEAASYPARFRIPPATMHGLDRDEQVKRAEMFALGSLLYEIFSGTKPFERLTDAEVQQRFSNADFPTDARSLPKSFLIYSAWSHEFALELLKLVQSQPPTLLQKFRNRVEANPALAITAIGGLGAATAPLWAPLVLGGLGFTALGPAAGSIAAGWQASLGLVQAGSLFAWCQGAAMGGAALGTIQAAAAGGAVVAAGAVGAVGVAGTANSSMADDPKWIEMFKRVYRKAES